MQFVCRPLIVSAGGQSKHASFHLEFYSAAFQHHSFRALHSSVAFSFWMQSHLKIIRALFLLQTTSPT